MNDSVVKENETVEKVNKTVEKENETVEKVNKTVEKVNETVEKVNERVEVVTFIIVKVSITIVNVGRNVKMASGYIMGKSAETMDWLTQQPKRGNGRRGKQESEFFCFIFSTSHIGTPHLV